MSASGSSLRLWGTRRHQSSRFQILRAACSPFVTPDLLADTEGVVFEPPHIAAGFRHTHSSKSATLGYKNSRRIPTCFPIVGPSAPFRITPQSPRSVDSL